MTKQVESMNWKELQKYGNRDRIYAINDEAQEILGKSIIPATGYHFNTRELAWVISQFSTALNNFNNKGYDYMMIKYYKLAENFGYVSYQAGTGVAPRHRIIKTIVDCLEECDAYKFSVNEKYGHKRVHYSGFAIKLDFHYLRNCMERLNYTFLDYCITPKMRKEDDAKIKASGGRL